MTTWEEGRTYDYYGQKIICVRRFFEGALELIEFKWPDQQVVLEDGTQAVAVGESFVRTAATLAPCVTPRVTDWLGGVLRPDACDHVGYARSFRRIVAYAGPNVGKVCCTGCGGVVEDQSEESGS